jgi:glycosyltransferase EpsE
MKNNNEDTPIVSVIMATFNEPKRIISLAITSILDQTLTNFELLIIDDSTNPETVNTINEFSADKRVIIIRDKKRIGFVKALNIGLRMAKGMYIARMDGDDIAEKKRLELEVSFLKKNPRFSVVGGSMNIINEKGTITSQRTYPTSSFKLNMWSIYRNPLAHPTVMFRRIIVDDGLFYDERFVKCEDLEFWLRLKKKGYRLYNIPDILLNFRVNDDLIRKRTGEHLIYNYKARYQNFSWSSPISCFFSLCISRAYIILPKYLVKRAYAIENKKK